MYVITKTNARTSFAKFGSLHNAALFKEEFIENFIMSKEGNSKEKSIIYQKPKSRHEWLSLPKGFILTKKKGSAGDFAKITCYKNCSSVGTFYNDYTVDKVFSIFILRIQKRQKDVEITIMNSCFIANHDALLNELKSKINMIVEHFKVESVELCPTENSRSNPSL